MQDASARNYIRWIKWFRFYAAQRGLDERAELTVEGARRFALWYVQYRHINLTRLDKARPALHALSRVYRMIGLNPPTWHVPRPPSPPASALLQEGVCGPSRPASRQPRCDRAEEAGPCREALGTSCRERQDLAHNGAHGHRRFFDGMCATFCAFERGGSRRKYSSFSRFLLVTGRISIALADSVIAPAQPKFERPHRALSWEDVRRLLRAVDKSFARGLRDYALLLMMSTYGLGAGEAIRLKFEDIDWAGGTIKLVRPKTGVAFTLPMLSAVAEALAIYLRDGRPRNTPTRHVFIRMKTPVGPLSCSSPVRHILIKHARVAGLNALTLAAMCCVSRMQRGRSTSGYTRECFPTSLVIATLESISAYVRIATETLRDISLPVPT